MKGLLRVINRSIKETVANPDAAIDLLAAQEPLIKKDIEKRRLLYRLWIADRYAGGQGAWPGRCQRNTFDLGDRDHRHVVRTAEFASGQ